MAGAAEDHRTDHLLPRMPPGPRHHSFDFTTITNKPRQSRGHAGEEPTTSTITASPISLLPSSLPQKPRRQHRRSTGPARRCLAPKTKPPRGNTTPRRGHHPITQDQGSRHKAETGSSPKLQHALAEPRQIYRHAPAPRPCNAPSSCLLSRPRADALALPDPRAAPRQQTPAPLPGASACSPATTPSPSYHELGRATPSPAPPQASCPVLLVHLARAREKAPGRGGKG
jgi:hypothetical protein